MYGGLDANLDELMREDEEPAEPTGAKIYRLLHLGWNRLELKAVLRLRREVPWGTKVVEEIHASGACVRKLHPEIATEPLRLRAHVHALRRVLPTLPLRRRRNSGCNAVWRTWRSGSRRSSAGDRRCSRS